MRGRRRDELGQTLGLTPSCGRACGLVGNADDTLRSVGWSPHKDSVVQAELVRAGRCQAAPLPLLLVGAQARPPRFPFHFVCATPPPPWQICLFLFLYFLRLKYLYIYFQICLLSVAGVGSDRGGKWRWKPGWARKREAGFLGSLWTWRDMCPRPPADLLRGPCQACAHLLLCLHSSPRLPPLALGAALGHPVTGTQRGEPVL